MLFVFLSILVLIVITLLFLLLPLGWEIMSRYIPELVPWGKTVWVWRVIIALTVLFTALLASHLFLPAGHRTLMSVLPGVFFTLVFWIGGSVAFGMYLEQFADYVSTYAGLAGAMIGLFFLYMLGLIFIFGGEINAAHARLKPSG